MNRNAYTLLALLALLAVVPVVNADVIADMYHLDLPAGLLEQVDGAFPGSGHIDKMDPALFTADANLHLSERATISLTFLEEEAGYHNEVGYFTFDNQGAVLEWQTVFDDFSQAGEGGCLTPGDTIDIGTFDAGTNIGFFLVPNGDPCRAAHTTLDSLNPCQGNYTAFFFDQASGYGILGFEDLVAKPSWGLDYNDAIMGISTTSIPEPATTGLLAMGALVLLGKRWNVRRKLT